MRRPGEIFRDISVCIIDESSQCVEPEVYIFIKNTIFELHIVDINVTRLDLHCLTLRATNIGKQLENKFFDFLNLFLEVPAV